MTEDADLRARIEARVAARRAASAASENRHPAADEGGTRRGRRVAGLFPVRRRTADAEDLGNQPFQLPAPSAAFGESWLLAGRTSEPQAETTDPEAEAVAIPAVDLVKEHTSPGAVRPPATPTTGRPSPGPHAATRRPHPGSVAAASGGLGARSLRRVPSGDGRSRTSAAAEPSAENQDEERKPTPRWRGTLLRTSVIALIAALAALLLRVFVVQPYYIPSASMEPTLHGCSGCNDDHVLVDKFSYRIHGPKAGDIVVFHRPKAANPAEVPESVLIKRVVAVGGDKIAIRKGRVYVNSLVLDEPYLNRDHSCYPSMHMASRTVPRNDVFVMGDNRCNSLDSRTFGPVATSSIIGRAFAIIWPLNRIRLLH